MHAFNALWRTYLLILVASLASAGAMIYIEWLDIKQGAQLELEYANNIVTRSMLLILRKNESLLRIAGKHLIELNLPQQSEEARTFINRLLEKNPELAGVGLADPSGQLILTSSNINRNNLPNLSDTPETAISFEKVLNSSTMVMGRTYYMKALRQWVVPIRYRITNSKGEVKAVMTAGLKLESTHSLWSNSLLPEHVQLTIIRDDFYRQYVSNINMSEASSWYDYAIDNKSVIHYRGIMTEQAGMEIEDLLRSGKVFSIVAPNKLGEILLTGISYDPVYGHYTFTRTPLRDIYAKLFGPVSWIAALLILFNTTLYFIFRSNIRLQESSRRVLKFQAKHDQLTKLPNRQYLLDEFEYWKDRYKGCFSVLFIDLNNFKAVNDLHGHAIGDRVLRKVTARIDQTFIEDLTIRQGGDEFIIITATSEADPLLRLCNDFLARLNQPIIIDNLEFSISASIGISHAPHDGSTIDELLRKADMAMYEAKRHQCDVYVYSKDIEDHVERTAKIENELIHALDRNELSVVYQPQVNADTHAVIGVEALLRWKNPLLGTVPPDEFIAVAESTGLIQDIGQYVLKTALMEYMGICKTISRQPNNTMRLSVNVSVRQLLNDSFFDFLSATLNEHDCTSVDLMLEITESIFIEEIDQIRLMLEKIEQLGVKISLDDFGTGYSSLGVLSELPISEIKVDKHFVHNIHTNDQDWLLIQSIISLSKSLGIPVLAEGVESIEQARMLSQHGCDLFQGYYFAKPMNKTDLTDFLLSQTSDPKQAIS